MNNSLFIEPNTLKNKINKPNIIILDTTFFLPDSGLNAEEEYQKEHIPNSVFFNVNKIADPKNPLPHMIPSKDLFSDMMQNLGLNNEDEIIIYDNSPLLSSARAWFLFRYFGHKNILILNGGLKKHTSFRLDLHLVLYRHLLKNYALFSSSCFLMSLQALSSN